MATWTRTKWIVAALSWATWGGLTGTPSLAQEASRSETAQHAGTVSGVVLDSRNLSPVPGATITISALGLSAVADEFGRFTLASVPPGMHRLVCAASGFRPVEFREVQVRTGETTKVTIDLQPADVRHEELVDVVAPMPRRGEDLPVGGATLSGFQVATAAGAMGDFARMLRGTAGAGGISDARNTIIARGGNPLENSFFVDDIEVPAISHLPDFASTGGYYSLIDPSVVREFDFIVGAFPVEHGQRLSSVTEVGYREGSRERFSGQARYDFALLGAGAEGPLPGGRGSWLASIRRADFVLLDDLLDWGDSSPQWIDAHVKLVYDLSPRHTLSLLDLYSGDQLVDPREWRTEFDRLRQNTVGVSWRATWSARLRSQTSLSHSRATWRHGYTYPPPFDAYDWHDDRKTEWVALRNHNWLSLGDWSRLEFGIQAKNGSQLLDYILNDPVAVGVPPDTIRSWTYRTTETAGFAAATVRPFDRLTTTAGARVDYSWASGRIHVSPRVSATFRLRDALHVNGAAGLVYQPIPGEFLAVHPEFLDLHDMRAAHYAVGLSYTGPKGWRATLEAYDKEYGFLPIDPRYFWRLTLDKEPFRSYTIPDALTDRGAGYARGVELTVQRHVRDRLLAAVSARVSRDRYSDVYGRERDRLYDSRYGFTTTIGYTPASKWYLSGSLIIQGGTPYTPTDETRSQQYGVWVRGGYNSARYPAYATLNLRAERRFAVGRITLSVYADVWNVLGRENVGWIDDWSPLWGDEYEYQMPRTPFFGASIAF